MAHIERRLQRSNDKYEALFYQLEACRERAKLDALVLADNDGLCVAASGDPTVCEEFAVHAAMVCDRTESFDGAVLSPTNRWEVLMQRVDVAGTDLYLCAVGGDPDGRAVEVDCSQGGVARILAA